MYLAEETFGAFAAYIDGFDVARGGAPLCGFREWLIVKAGDGSNLSWHRLVLNRSLHNSGQPEAMKAEDAIRRTAALVLEFVAYREEWGLRTVFGEYDQWLRKQEWYSEELHGHHGQLVRRGN